MWRAFRVLSFWELKNGSITYKTHTLKKKYIYKISNREVFERTELEKQVNECVAKVLSSAVSKPSTRVPKTKCVLMSEIIVY